MKDKLIIFGLEVGKDVLESINNILVAIQIGMLVGVGGFIAFYVFVVLYLLVK